MSRTRPLSTRLSFVRLWTAVLSLLRRVGVLLAPIRPLPAPSEPREPRKPARPRPRPIQPGPGVAVTPADLALAQEIAAMHGVTPERALHLLMWAGADASRCPGCGGMVAGEHASTCPVSIALRGEAIHVAA